MTRGQKETWTCYVCRLCGDLKGKPLATKDTEAEVWLGGKSPRHKERTDKLRQRDSTGTRREEALLGGHGFQRTQLDRRGASAAQRRGQRRHTRRKNELTVFTWEMAKDRSWTCTKQEQEEAS
ncbi:hypothetical protein ERJ75_001079900 [Trypanosoma vivax]|nr:hypothetical protein ERJ75_001079900 [Trypanosoma vivax]